MTFHPLDIITALLGLAYILFEFYASKWMWAVGFIMQLLGIVLYYQKGIYADCAMEFYYLGMTVYGFLCWKGFLHRSAAKAQGAMPITHMPLQRGLLFTLLAAALWGAIYYLLDNFTDSTVPALDSFTTALSMVGIWALAHKYLEQWIVWIMVDIVTCFLYHTKGLPFKSALYALYVVIAIAGFFRWRKLMLAER